MTADAGPSPTGLDSLAIRWWAAFDAAREALHSAGPYIGSHEQGERSRNLTDERSETMQLLRELARIGHASKWLHQWLAAPSLTRRMLGLPDGVAACVFDLDGVLTTSATMHAVAWAETFDPFLLSRSELGHRQFVPFDPEIEYREHIAGRPRLDGARGFLASRGISLPEGRVRDTPGAETIHGLANRKNEVLRRHLEQEGVTAFAGSRFYLEAARSIGVHRAVVSASLNTSAILERAGLAQLIEHCVDGATIEAEHLLAKPAPDTIAAVCRQLVVEPGQLVAFETTADGIAAARAAGVRLVVCVERGGPPVGAEADVVVNDLAELFGRS